MLKDFEKEWLKDKVNLDKTVIPDDLHRKGIIFNLYGDKFSHDLKKGMQFVYKTFPSSSEIWQECFDMIIPDYENNIFYFYYLINSDENLNYKNTLKSKLTYLVKLIKDLKTDNSDNNYLWNFTFKNNLDVREIIEDFINDPEATEEILIYDLGDKLNSETLSSILKEANLSNLKVNVLKTQLYKTKVLENLNLLNSEFSSSNKEKRKFTFDYYDSDPSKTDEGANRNFIKYISANNTSNYIFSFSAKNLVAAYGRFEEIIFERNIRYGLMKEGKQVNNGIRQTINETPKDFWILNNGLTIVAKEIDINEVDKTVTLADFNIVNGAQTVTNLDYVVKTKNKDVLEGIFIPTKIIIIGENQTEENLENQISRIVQSANNQKAVKNRDFVSNDKNMKELKAEFKKHDIVLNIKRGDQGYADRLDAEDIRKIRGNIEIETTKNEEVGKEIIALIMQNPAKALQVKNKIFDPENYSRVFKNENIDYENIVYLHKFKSKINDMIEKLIKENEINFATLANSILSNNKTEELENNLRNLYKHTYTWFISMLYFIVYMNQNQDKNLVSLNPITNEINKKMNSSFWYSSLFLVNNEKLIVSDYPTPEFKRTLISLLNESILEINNIFINSLKEKPRTLPAFSFMNTFYKEFLAVMYRRYEHLIIPFLKQIL